MTIPGLTGAMPAVRRIRHAAASCPEVWAAILVAAAAFLAFYPALRCGFIHLDDPDYVFNNPGVMGGLSAEGISAAFRVFKGEYWTPVLFLSLMADAQLFGASPWGFHFVNVLFHCANALLLFLLLDFSTRRMVPAVLTALFFALHPLRVESVVWVSQRRDVLFTFLLLLSLAAYGCFARRPGRRRRVWYILALLLFALSLMAKPMAIAFPLLLLFVDLWPLGRAPIPDRHLGRWFREHRNLLIEKAPFLAVAAVFAAMTVVFQWRLSPPNQDPVSLLIASMRMYFVYLGQMVWPAGLGIRLQELPMKELASSGPQAFLVHCFLLTWVWRSRIRHPYVFSGWLWYLAALLPAVGGLAFGGQWISDRFTYLPLMGVAAGSVYTLDRIIVGKRQRAMALLFSFVALFGLGRLTWRQIGFWESPRAIAQRSVDISPGDSTAWFSLGNALFNDGDMEGARAAMTKAVRLAPDSPLAQGGLGMVFMEAGDMASARRHLEEGFRLGFANPAAQYSLGKILFDEGDCAQALGHLLEALRLGLPPDQAEPARRMAAACVERMGMTPDANQP